MQQLSTWAQLGRLTYFNAVRALPPTLAQRVSTDHRLSSFFRPQSLPSAQRLLGLANQVAQEVASGMESQAKEMESQGEEQAQQAPLTFQQAQQLKRLVTAHALEGHTSTTRSSGNTSSALLSPFSPSSSSTSNHSLLLRTWLEQLRLSSELHPLAMEIVQKLNLASVQRGKSKVGRPSARKKAKKEQEHQVPQQHVEQEEDEREVHNAEKHVMLMASLVLTVQMTQETAGSQDTPVAPTVTSSTSASRADHARRDGGTFSAPADALPSLLSNVAAPASDTYLPPTSIAANWLPSLSPFPSSLSSARALPAHSQSEFVRWMGEVAMARLELPKEFEVYVEEVAKVESAGRMRQARLRKRLSSMIAPQTSSGTLVSRLLACERVISYSSNRRGAYHPAYATLLQRCSALLGLRSTATLHAAVQRVIRLAQASTAKTESVYVDTTQQRQNPSMATSSTIKLPQQHPSESSPVLPASGHDDPMEVDDQPNDSAEAVVVSEESSSAHSPSPPVSFRRSSRVSSASSSTRRSSVAPSSTRSSSASPKAPTRGSSVSSLPGSRV